MATQSLSPTSLVRRTIAKSKTPKVRDIVAIVKAARAEAALLASQAPITERLSPVPADRQVRLTPEEATQFRRFINAAKDTVDLPTEVREFTQDELDSLIPAWALAKGVKKVIERVEESFRTGILTHNTILAEKGRKEDDDPIEYDKNGFAVVKGKYTAPGSTSTVSIETQAGQLKLEAEDLAALAKDPATSFTAEDFERTTKWVRVIDEDEVISTIIERPEIAELIADRAVVGSPQVKVVAR